MAPDHSGLDLFLDGQADRTERLAAGEDLLNKLDDLDSQTQQLVITTLADLAPANLLDDPRLTPSQENSPEQNDFLRQALVGVIDQIEPARIATNLDQLAAGWFGDSDETRQQFDQVIVPRLNQINSIAELDSNSLSHLNPDQQLELLSGVIERGDVAGGLECAEDLFGTDQATGLLIYRADSRPQLAEALLGIFYIPEAVDRAIEAGEITAVANKLRFLVLNLPQDQLAEVVDKLIEAGEITAVANNLHYLADSLTQDKLAEAVDRAIEAGEIITVANRLNRIGLHLPQDQLAEVVDKLIEAEVVDRAIEAGEIATVANNIPYLADSLPPDQLAEVVDKLIEAGQIATMANRLYWLTDKLPQDKLAEVVDRAIEAGEIATVANNLDCLSGRLTQDKLAEAVDRAIEAGETTTVANKLNYLADSLPPDQLAEVVDKLVEAGEIATVAFRINYLTDRLPQDKLVEVVDRAIEAGEIALVANKLNYLALNLPPDQLVELVDKLIEAGAISMVADRLDYLADKLPPDKLVEVVDRAIEAGGTRVNEVIDLYRLGGLPHPSGEGVTQMTKLMELDDRSGLAPGYFQEIIRRLPRAEGKPSFAILFKEAMDTYSQIDNILGGGYEAREMLVRIQATLGRRGPGADRDSIALANAVLRQGCDPAEIETALEAKAYPLHSLNRDLGLELDVSEASIDQLTEAMGNLLPASIYARQADQPVRSRLAEIITALASDSYHHHKYPARQPLIEAGILPPIDEAAYQRWQTANTTDSAEVVANTAADVSDKIRQVVGPALSSHRQLEDFNHLPDPKAKIEAIGAALAQLGQQIGATHRQKQHGEISPDQAEVAVASLGAQKQQLELARDAVRLAGVTGSEVASGKLHNEDGRPTQATISQTLDKLAAIDLGQSSETLSQLREMLDNYAAAATTDIGRIIVSDVDDYQTTIEIGANPVGSCQHYESGSLNQGLLGYFEPGVKIITARNDNGGLIARAILRLAFDPDGSPAMVLEPTYTSQASNDIEGAVKDHAKAKAANMGLQLYSSGSSEKTTITLPQLSGAPQGYSDLATGLYKSGQTPVSQLALVGAPISAPKPAPHF